MIDRGGGRPGNRPLGMGVGWNIVMEPVATRTLNATISGPYELRLPRYSPERSSSIRRDQSR
jgi:hypothetical protein